MRNNTIRLVGITAAALLAATACGGREDSAGTTAQGDCGGQQTTGITDTSIKLGGIYPLSGPASAYGEIPKAVKAYFDYVNAEKGGINGRKIEYVVRDDGYQPPKSVEEARRLTEQENVFALFQTLGTATSSAVMEYANQRKIPQVFVASGATKWGADPAKYPWTIGWQPSYQAEGRVYGQYLIKEKPSAKVAVLYQNDDFGKDLRDGFAKGIEGSGVKIVAEQSYEVTDPSVDPQLRNLAGSGADVLLNITTPKFASQALAADAKNTEWNPLHIVNNVSSSMTVLKPVGFDKVQNIVSSAFLKDPSDPQWAADPEMKLYEEKLKKYAPGLDTKTAFYSLGWASASGIEQAIARMKCPTREGLMEAARSLTDVRSELLLPGITMSTTPQDGYPIETLQLVRFQGERWTLFGEAIDTRKESR
ncbi:amino acid/amide ABC transporter substrate-binding protein, HAAT family [Actinokineospora alba]|uniref:Amino acid/amide ABC transporter substrate-binding protein, HAAT family n=1 Tax=Actinokineospora alba TaxID=504798 RepID=A0A1H0LT95_9PSEU|nr:ABC transporter substrate-binding protein [Actinokineospora alba]TDP67446.1 branched-chain amino acid transport system substrate-binding protein [Actinokineospora alba]SDI96405.1 branched-chain amino acid transport system substrate-binding protein [Actinokineospora alba]SDO71354.1 amino acid/amide ABC transporter substrate-binding protein, HAAT family [Actinokineospora alba]